MSWTRAGVLYYAAAAAVSALAFLVFLFTIGGGQPSGPGVFLALAVFILAVVVRLLYQAARALVSDAAGDEVEVRATGRRRKELEREYQALKRALKELDLDHAMGKLSDADHDEIRARYRDRAVRVLRQLDQGDEGAVRRQIEQDLAARREALQARIAAGPPKCAGCGARNDEDAAFCKKCGKALREATA